MMRKTSLRSQRADAARTGDMDHNIAVVWLRISCMRSIKGSRTAQLLFGLGLQSFILHHFSKLLYPRGKYTRNTQNTCMVFPKVNSSSLELFHIRFKPYPSLLQSQTTPGSPIAWYFKRKNSENCKWISRFAHSVSVEKEPGQLAPLEPPCGSLKPPKQGTSVQMGTSGRQLGAALKEGMEQKSSTYLSFPPEDSRATVGHLDGQSKQSPNARPAEAAIHVRMATSCVRVNGDWNVKMLLYTLSQDSFLG